MTKNTFEKAMELIQSAELVKSRGQSAWFSRGKTSCPDRTAFSYCVVRELAQL